jgi:hypothetical protein
MVTSVSCEAAPHYLHNSVSVEMFPTSKQVDRFRASQRLSPDVRTTHAAWRTGMMHALYFR